MSTFAEMNTDSKVDYLDSLQKPTPKNQLPKVKPHPGNNSEPRNQTVL